MNLTTPPPVEHLDPGYAAEVKQDLVRKARQSRKRRTQSWTPILAAACACALITTGVFYLSHTGDRQVEPSSPTTPASPTTSAKVLQVPAEASAIEHTDIHPAIPRQGRAAARECLAPRGDAYGNTPDWLDPKHADTATIRSARWVKDPRGPDGQSLVLSFDSNVSGMAFHCVNSRMIWWSGSGDFYQEKDAVTGTWSSTFRGNGPKLTADAEYRFRTADHVDRVQLRIRGVDGASPWYSVKVVDNMGYVAGQLPGVPRNESRLEVDARGFDAAGKQVWSKTYG